MQLIPGVKILKCPCCGSMNIVRFNGVTYNNNHKSLEGHILKKILTCRKCKEELGVFHKEGNNRDEKVLWLENVVCNDQYYEILKKLEDVKIKNSKSKNKKYYEAINEISDINNKIRQDKIKLKIKLKIQKKGMLIRHVY